MQRDLELGCLLYAAVQSVIDGTWDGSNYYGGMNENLVGITSLAVFARMEHRRLWILQKKIFYPGKNGVFDGVIETNTGETVGEEGKRWMMPQLQVEQLVF